MTGKQLLFPYRSRSNSKETRGTSRYTSPDRPSSSIYGNIIFKPTSRTGSPYSPKYIPQSPKYKRNGNRSQRPLSRNCPRNVRNFINSLLDQEQTGNTASNTEHMETQKVPEEQFIEQHFDDILSALNQDTQKIILTVRKNVKLSQKNTFFLHRVNAIFVHYHSQYIHNRHTIIHKQFPATSWIRLSNRLRGYTCCT